MQDFYLRKQQKTFGSQDLPGPTAAHNALTTKRGKGEGEGGERKVKWLGWERKEQEIKRRAGPSSPNSGFASDCLCHVVVCFAS